MQNGIGRRLVDPERISIEDLTGDDVYVTERGWKLKVLAVPWDLVAEARNRVPMPEAPLLQVYDEAGKPVPGKFDQNYMDPKYQKAMDEWNDVVRKLTWQIMFSYGVTAYSVPEGFYPPYDEHWVEDIKSDDVFSVGEENYGIEVAPASQPRRRLADYFRLYVLTLKDTQLLNDALMRGLGKVLEADVDTAVESFPGSEGRVSDSGDAPPPKQRSKG